MLRIEYDRLVEIGALGSDELRPYTRPTDERRHEALVELIDDERVVVGVRAEHQLAVEELEYAASDDSEPEPGLAVMPPRSGDRSHPEGLLLVVEVADTSLTKDRVVKGRLYAECGVRST